MMTKEDRFIYKYDEQLGIASIEDQVTGIRVLTILYNNEVPELKRATYMAYLAARYSRSHLSIAEIAGEVLAKGKFTESMRSIVHNYGHASVQDLSNVLVCIEEVPGFVADKFFYKNYCVAGQQRSSRYQDFSKTKWARFDPFLDIYYAIPKSIEEEYNSIMQESIANYQESIRVTKDSLAKMFDILPNSSATKGALQSRTLDCSRFLLPIGANSSFAALMSPRSWSTYIRQCANSSNYIEKELATMLEMLLVGNDKLAAQGYIPEADVLIRHTEPIYHEEEVVYQLMSVVQKYRDDPNREDTEHFSFAEDMWTLRERPSTSAVWNGTHTDLIEKLLLLVNPIELHDVYAMEVKKVLKELGDIIFSSYSQYNTMGDLGISGAIRIDGMSDLGSLRDLVRHRSLNKFIPLYNNNVNFLLELNREEGLCYELPAYTEGDPDLRKWYRDRLKVTYKRIKNWLNEVSSLPEEVATEYGRYMLPFAHSTFYRFYGDIDKLNYTIRTRIRPGGHINYRLLVHSWLTSLANMDGIWNSLLDVLPKPDITSREEFLDRS